MIELVAPAKLNLALHVRARRADGFHEIETIFGFLRDGDVLTIAPAERDGFEIAGPFADGLAGTEDNLVTRARDMFREAFCDDTAVAITLDKRLPVASGIGGGSADAAATLRGLARLRGIAGDDARLRVIALTLGSDVPACLNGTAAIGRGRGEQLIPAVFPTGLPVLLVNPGVPVATASVFAGWDGVDRGPLGEGDAWAAALAGRNDLEPAAIAIAPAISDVLARLAAASGTRLARMSGSGATCFAIFDDVAARDRAADVIAVSNPEWWMLRSALV